MIFYLSILLSTPLYKETIVVEKKFEIINLENLRSEWLVDKTINKIKDILSQDFYAVFNEEEHVINFIKTNEIINFSIKLYVDEAFFIKNKNTYVNKYTEKDWHEIQFYIKDFNNKITKELNKFFSQNKIN